MTIEELQAELEEAKGVIEALNAKNREISSELKKERMKNKDIDLDAFYKMQDENESLKSNADKDKSTIDKLSNDLSIKDRYIQKITIDDGLTRGLLENGVDKAYLKHALAMLKSEAQIRQNGDTYEALIGDKTLNEFLPYWVNEGDGKLFITKIPDVGGGSRGGATGSENKPVVKTLKETFTEMFPN